MVNEVNNSATLEIPVELIKAQPNDQELGKRVRALYYSLKEQENADQERSSQADLGKD